MLGFMCLQPFDLIAHYFEHDLMNPFFLLDRQRSRNTDSSSACVGNSVAMVKEWYVPSYARQRRKAVDL